MRAFVGARCSGTYLKIASDHFPNLLKVMINLPIHSICGYKIISIICVDKIVCQNLFYIFYLLSESIFWLS